MKPRILVIDDEGRHPRLDADDLEYEGYEFLAAATGRRHRPCRARVGGLVFLDIKMPAWTASRCSAAEGRAEDLPSS